MATYKSTHTGGQVDTAVNQILNNGAKVQYGNIIGTLTNQTDLKAALDAKENLSNKVTSISSTSTDTQYPSAKVVYDELSKKQNNLVAGSAININESEVAVSLYDPSKFTVVGNPTITEDGIASGFSSSNYLTTYTEINPNNQLEMIFKFTTGTDVTSGQYISGATLGSTSERFALNIQEGQFQCPFGANSINDISSWGKFGTVTTNSTNYIKITWNGVVYKILHSLDETNWQELKSISSTTPIHFSEIWLGRKYASNQAPFLGQIDLKQFSITVDGVEVFSGSRTIYNKLESLDTKYEKAIKQEYEIYDEKEGFEQLEAEKRSTFDRSKFTVVGSPTITDDGIVRGVVNNGAIRTPEFDITKSFKIECEIPLYDNGEYKGYRIGELRNSIVELFRAKSSQSFLIECYPIGTAGATQFYPTTPFNQGDVIKFVLEHDGNLSFTTTVYINGILHGSQTTTVSSLENIPNKFSYTNDRNAYQVFDLKQFSITVDGVEVFNGNKTGIDQIKKDDYTVVGSPTITNDGIVSGFSKTNYLKKALPIDFTNANCFKVEGDFVINGTVDNGDRYQNIFHLGNINIGNNDPIKVLVSQKSNAVALVYPISETQKAIGTFKYITWGEEYHFVIEANATTMKFFINDTLISDVAVNSSLWKHNRELWLGNSINDAQWEYINGSIDLNSFKIYVDDQLVYQPTLRIPYTQSKTGSKIVDSVYRDRVQDMYEQFGYTHYYTIGDEPEKYNVSVVGSPTLVGGVASGFSSDNYLKTNYALDTSNDWEIDLKIKTPVRLREYQESYCLGYLNTDRNITFGVENAVQKFKLYLSSDGTSWDILNGTTNEQFELDTWYYIKIGYKNGTYYLKKSIDGNTWSGNWTKTSDLKVKTNINLYAGTSYAATRFYDGQIDLKQFSITVDGKEVFRGYEPAIPNAYTFPTNSAKYAPALLYPTRSAGFATAKFLIADKQNLTVKGKTSIVLGNGEYMYFLNDQTFTITDLLDTGSALTAGKDYYVYATNDQKLVVSLDATAPSGYTTYSATKIGGFHTICRTVTSSNAPVLITTSTYQSFWSTHPAIGYTAGDAIPISTWTIAHRPYSSPEGMVYVSGDYGEEPFWADIYLQSGTGVGTKSAFGATITNNRNPIAHQFDMNHVGKKLMTDSQFTIFAEGSNNKTNVAGSAQPSPFTAGGHLDTANTAMISGFFGEECCGLVWQWLDELAPTGGSAWNAYANTERGQSYGMPYVLRAGGAWGDSTNCGSWSRGSVGTRSGVVAHTGARGVSRCLPWNYFD